MKIKTPKWSFGVYRRLKGPYLPTIPKGFRQLRKGEYVAKGDLFLLSCGEFTPAASIGRKVGSGLGLLYFRRK